MCTRNETLIDLLQSLFINKCYNNNNNWWWRCHKSVIMSNDLCQRALAQICALKCFYHCIAHLSIAAIKDCIRVCIICRTPEIKPTNFTSHLLMLSFSLTQSCLIIDMRKSWVKMPTYLQPLTRAPCLTRGSLVTKPRLEHRALHVTLWLPNDYLCFD